MDLILQLVNDLTFVNHWKANGELFSFIIIITGGVCGLFSGVTTYDPKDKSYGYVNGFFTFLIGMFGSALLLNFIGHLVAILVGTLMVIGLIKFYQGMVEFFKNINIMRGYCSNLTHIVGATKERLQALKEKSKN
jgi:uncharacterized membrane protein